MFAAIVAWSLFSDARKNENKLFPRIWALEFISIYSEMVSTRGTHGLQLESALMGLTSCGFRKKKGCSGPIINGSNISIFIGASPLAVAHRYCESLSLAEEFTLAAPSDVARRRSS